MDELYDEDILAWAEQQVENLRRRAAFTPSMAQRLDVAALYGRALRRLPETMDGVAPLQVPEICSLSIQDLLDS